MSDSPPKETAELEFEQELHHDEYDKMTVKCDAKTVEISVYGCGERVMMNHAEFDAVVKQVERYRKCAEAANVEIS